MVFETEAPKPRTAAEVLLIPNEKIYPNPNQPRRQFDQGELVNLAISIRMNGILQPLTVRQTDKGYELIAGERRLRASRLAGLATVPCIVSNVDDVKSAVFSLIENLQRQNLNCFEEAQAIDRLIKAYSLGRDDISRLLGKSPSTVSNKLRLLSLPEETKQKMTEYGLTERHARALLRLDPAQTLDAVEKIKARELNVSQTEKLVDEILQEKNAHRKPAFKLFSDVKIFVNTVNRAVETMQGAGIPAVCKRHDTEDAFRYEIIIPKCKAQKKN